MRQNRPEVIRGQLAWNYWPEQERPLYERIGGTALLSNVVTRPDFVAYRFSDRDNPAVRLSCDVLGGHLVVWTVRNEQDLRAAEAAGAVVIFEGFLPE